MCVCMHEFCWFRELLIKLATKHYHVSQFCWFELVDWCQHSDHRCYWEWKGVSIQLQNILFDNNISIELLFPFIITHFIFIFLFQYQSKILSINYDDWKYYYVRAKSEQCESSTFVLNFNFFSPYIRSIRSSIHLNG